jgi:hypothetical protein
MSAKATRLRERLSINPDEVAPSATHHLSTEPEGMVQPESTRSNGVAGSAEPHNSFDRSSDAEVATDEALAGRSDYRSFYVNDEIYFRFRAAIFWSSRNPKAVGHVPDNMSAAVEQWMGEVATDLERRYNDGEAFPSPPPPRRQRRQRIAKS